MSTQDAGATPDTTPDAFIVALLAERAGYVARGLADRVAQVDEQLAARGARPPATETPATRPPERAVPTARRERR